MQRPPKGMARLTRRDFLRIAGVTALGTLASTALGTRAVQGLRKLGGRPSRTDYWSDPQTWGGKIPGRNDVAVVSKRIILDVDARVRGVVVKRKGDLVFHPRRSVSLRSDGNVVVRGRLTIRPKTPAILHQLLFPRVDESRFIGGGIKVIPTDVGLWVTGKGVLNIAGSPKLAWTRAKEGIAAGSTSLTLREDPVGWRVGDEVALTPTLSPSDPNFDVAYDLATVTAVDRPTHRIMLGTPTTFEHPAVEVQPGVVLTAEVLNLTRNVRIEGTQAGRSHVWIRSSRRQRIRNASLRFTGPRRPRAPDPNFPPSSTEPVPGRYGVHLHMMGEASRGSLVSGVVMRDSGSHAFVAHQSHGVTFRDCISHDTFEEAYWWDPSPDMHTPAPPTDDVLYERCVASLVRADPPWWGLRTAGFFLGARNGNAIRDCVAVGIQGSVDSSGYVWPEMSGGVWKFEDCLAHNNRMNGIFTWQNNDAPHVVSRFTAYHNGWAGIDHGAYLSSFLYKDCVLYGNRFAAIESRALSFSSPTQTLSRVRCDQAGLSPYCVVTTPHLAAPAAPVQFKECHFRGYGKAAFGFVDQASPFPNIFNIVDSVFEGNEFWLGPDINPATGIRVHDAAHGNITLRRADQPGIFRPEWNASVSPFA
jgi:hypothetical protein